MSYTPEDKRRYFLLVVLIIVNITIEYSLSRFAYIIDIKKQNSVYGEEQLTKPSPEEQLEIVEMLGGAFAVNTVIDESRRLSYINFGEIRKSHIDAVKFVRQYCEIVMDKQYSTVVTTSAGYPLDKTYYQTVKGMVTPLDILEEGGNLIIASE